MFRGRPSPVLQFGLTRRDLELLSFGLENRLKGIPANALFYPYTRPVKSNQAHRTIASIPTPLLDAGNVVMVS
jgi:hypothetical protein